TKPALYYHFGSKEELFKEAVRTCFLSNEPLVEQARAAADDIRGQLVAFADALFERVTRNPVRMKLVLSMQNVADKAQPDVELHAHHQRGIDLVAGLIAEGRDRGELRADLDVHEAALILLGALHTRAWLALKGVSVAPSTPAHIVDLLLTGFQAPPTPDGD
ncbi:MAG: TetR/AcrR family transcriptional regulator, partial [Deltaproteobacteria bacterium]